MSRERVCVVIGIVLALLSLAVVTSRHEPIMAVLSLVAVLLGFCAYRCSIQLASYSFVFSSIVVFICSMISTFLLDQGSFLVEGMPENIWFISVGFIRAIAVIPLVFTFFIVMTHISQGSMDFKAFALLAPFIGVGMIMPGFIVEYASEISREWITNNGYLMFCMLVTMVLILVAALVFAAYMVRNKTYITRNGLEVLD